MQLIRISCLVLGLSATSFADNLKPSKWVTLPAIGSSPETGFQYGAYVMRIFEQTKASQPQNRLEVVAQGTTNGQFQAYVWPNIYLENGDYNLRAKLGGQFWPSGYYGENNGFGENDSVKVADDYSDASFESSISLYKRIQKNVSLGVSAFAEYHDITNTTVAPFLLTDDVAGANGGLFSGAGLKASYDSRNNGDWPTEGAVINSSLDVFTRTLGSDIDFQVLAVNAAAYLPVSSHILAIGGQAKAASDGTPFTHLPRPSGDRSLRGANGNRWLGKRSLGLQTEYRVPFAARWAAVGFVDTFQVASEFSDMAIDEFHYSTGLGIRYATTEDRFNIRFDIGLVDAQDVSFALTVGEAF